MTQQRVCPWWLGYTFILPFRKYQHNPDKIVGPYVKTGAQVMDYGCAMGYFSIPMAKITGKSGKVYCVDIQQKMLENLNRRAIKYQVDNIVKPLLINESYKPETLASQLDFVLLFAVVHEVPDQQKLFNEISMMLKTGGKVMFAEPKGHVKPGEFNHSIELARNAGLQVEQLNVLGDGKLSVLLIKN
jgi:2-polyprenyl-3-methyl-5-hydroxy-6-metoxy-1,4-benzoquinol methylase